MRASARSSSFAAVTLALGVGASVVTFAVVDSVVFRPLPFQDPDELVLVGPVEPVPKTVSVQAYGAWQDRMTTLVQVGATSYGPLIHLSDDGSTRARAWRLTASVFGVLGVRPHLGRTFTAENEATGNDGVAVISHGLWQRMFGGDPSAIGRRLNVGALRDSSRPVGTVEIIGVMPSGFRYPVDSNIDVWIPNVPGDAYTPGRRRNGELRGDAYLQVVGRLAPGATIGQAQAELDAINADIAGEPGAPARDRPTLVPLHDALVENSRSWMVLVLLSVAAVLIVACVNVTILMLAREDERFRARSVRAALGASRLELAATSAAETALVACGALVLGVTLSYWWLGLAVVALPSGIPRADQIAIDYRVLLTIGATTVLVCSLAGSVHAWVALRTQGLSASGALQPRPAARSRRWRGALAAAQVAMVAAILLVVTPFIWSFVRVSTSDIGFDRHQLAAIRLPAEDAEGVLSALRAMHWVEDAAVVAGTPPLVLAAFGGDRTTVTLRATSEEGSAPQVSATQYHVSAEYFAVMRVPFLAGRSFDDGDRGTPVAVIDEKLCDGALQRGGPSRWPGGVPTRFAHSREGRGGCSTNPPERT